MYYCILRTEWKLNVPFGKGVKETAYNCLLNGVWWIM